MKFSYRFCLFFVVAAVQNIKCNSSSIYWRSAGIIRWALNCDFRGNDFTSQKSTGEECGNICQTNRRCSHFNWTLFNGGTCWLKTGIISPDDAEIINASGSEFVCGYISTGFDWKISGAVRWFLNCDFYGNLLTFQKSRGEDCGGICEANSRCTHFTWTKELQQQLQHILLGTCWLKEGPITPDNAFVKTTESALCGYIDGRKPIIDQVTSTSVTSVTATTEMSVPVIAVTNTPVTGIRGSFWDEILDGSSCQLPDGEYRLNDTIALGQADQLGALKWKPGLCGQVLRIDCGNGPIDAVVSSACSLNSNRCGIDMIKHTWERATDNQVPGIVRCEVQLTEKNPIVGLSPLCFRRNNSETDNKNVAVIGLLNTSGKLTSSATLAGVPGRRNNGGWFEFNADGHFFVEDAKAIFQYEDGTSYETMLKKCQSVGSVKMFSNSQ